MAALCLAIAAGVADILVDLRLAVWFALPLPALILIAFYAAIGVHPRLFKANTHAVLVGAVVCFELAMLTYLADIHAVFTVVFAAAGTIILFVAPTRAVGA